MSDICWELKSLKHQSPLIPSSYLVEDIQTLVFIKRRVKELWTLPPQRKGSPMPNSISIQRCHFQQHMKTKRYVVLEKSDGVRYLLFMTRMPGGGECKAFMIDRKEQCWEISVIALEIHFDGQGTLFDGELVHNDSDDTLVYLIFDIIASPRFPSILRYPLVPDRIDALRSLIYNVTNECDENELEYQVIQGHIVSGCRAPVIYFRVKTFFRIENIMSVLRQHHGHRSDGLIFMPSSEPIATGTHVTCFKWKPDHTIDFSLEFNNGETFLNTMTKKKPNNVLRNGLRYKSRVFHVYMSNAPNQILQALEQQHQQSGEIVSYIVECHCDVDFLLHIVSCFILRVRTDKARPNSTATLIKTLASIEESITMTDLEELCRQFCCC